MGNESRGLSTVSCMSLCTYIDEQLCPQGLMEVTASEVLSGEELKATVMDYVPVHYSEENILHMVATVEIVTLPEEVIELYSNSVCASKRSTCIIRPDKGGWGLIQELGYVQLNMERNAKAFLEENAKLRARVESYTAHLKELRKK
ncbi:hypothetical protein V6N11_064990 [Hibiscus sabdariffa]|uniref:Uncharacterized protein n=1 Tax=Hibiscus sabdariffa TaxID=183260 RepID=A0ABR2SIQ8_9ROSI